MQKQRLANRLTRRPTRDRTELRAVGSHLGADELLAQRGLLELARGGTRDLLDELVALGQLPLGVLTGEVLAQLVGPRLLPSRSTIAASGRSPQRSSGMAITAASATAGWAMSRFSRSTEEIHSPPDLTRSLDRSQILRFPRGSIVTTSPVWNQPSSVNFSVP